MNSYQISTNKVRGDRVYYHITVPREMASRVPQDVTFSPEWHPDGILYRAIRVGNLLPTQPTPDWLK